MADEFKCARCAADPQPEDFGSPRNCAFKADGNFTPDNWNCATMAAMLEGSKEINGEDETLEYTPANGGEFGGWIVTTRYKHRGCTSSAIHVGDFYPPLRLTLEIAQAIIAQKAKRR